MMMTENGKVNRNKKKGGFTTVELIVTVVLLMILAGGLVFGIVKWVEYTNFKRQNEYARTIFVAAQNQLTEYGEGGKLEDLAARLPKDGKGQYVHHIEDVTQLTDSEGKNYESLSEIWPESAGKTNGEVYRDTICYINVTAKDYQAYLNGTASDEATALYELLSSYLYDMSILNASLCVEFTPEEGQVFSVLYSDRVDAFAYTDTEGSVNISDRSTSYRKAHMIGYYGVDTLYRATSSKAEKPSITDVRLNNEETLNLSFSLGKIPSAAQQLTYEINVYDTSNKKLLFKLLLDGTKIKESGSREGVSCPVYRYTYKDDGISIDETLEMGEYSVLAWIEKNGDQKSGTIRVVFDAADLKANAVLYYDAYIDLMSGHVDATTMALNSLKNTYTIRRFGVAAEDIYCTIQGSGEYYKTTAKKQSNVENASFGSMQSGKSSGESTASYTIKNARHLYNLRYMEDYTDSQRQGDYEGLSTADHIAYLLDDNFDWDEFVSSGALYNSGGVVRKSDDNTSQTDDRIGETDIAFPSIKQLRACSEFYSNSSKPYKITGLTMTEAGNTDAKLYTYASGEEKAGAQASSGTVRGSVGLFLINDGLIDNVTLDAVDVSGKSKVGAFCAINRGVLSDLTVADSDAQRKSRVSGEDYIGGVFGCQEVSSEASMELSYKGLTNRAHVSGKTNVGGITGYLSAGNERTVSISDCQNYGQLSVVDKVTNKDGNTVDVEPADAMYIGGIIGYAKAERSGNSKKAGQLTINQCTSSPQYSTDEIEAIIDNENTVKSTLKGIYVGGIVGYNDGGNLTNCNTVKESASKEGYVFGYRFVGGIVGYNVSANTSGTTELDGNVTGFLTSKNSINEAHVVGDSYVGGVVGCNALPKNNGNNKEIEPDKTLSEKVAIRNWTNKGIVVARSDYAGGISGFNSGIISNCICEVENSDVVKTLAKSSSLQGDYVGGIAGYNSGRISAAQTISVICYTAGTNYLGGIVGYNAISGDIKGYEVGGGYVVGKGCFVGGYVGLNASGSLLNNASLNASPNEVSGTYCVGGTMGANMASSGDLDFFTTNFQNDNFLGTLEAEAFAGGFIGYNVLLKEDGLESGNNDRIREAANAAIASFEEIAVPVDTSDGQYLINVEDILKKMLSDGKLQVSNADFIINGKLGSSGTGQSKFGGLTARIFVGGVIGYNDENTNLCIQNVTNKTPVTATASIINIDEQPDRRDEESFTYSYAGGIIGKVSQKTILSVCKNEGSGDVISQGTYLGGLCEINEGKIYNCSVSSIGSNEAGCVGGITGLNKKGASIVDTSFIDKTVTGRKTVGGVAAENFGTISDTILQDAKVIAVSDAGGIAGFSGELATVTVQSQNNVYISATGENVGGLIGKNEGIILTEADQSLEAGSTISGSVNGASNVGGLIGYNISGDISFFHNTATVTAENGDAGGIVGKSDSGLIKGCTNENNVLSLKSGNAGGIIGVNSGTIQECYSKDKEDGAKGNISAPNGMCGGIAGINNGRIDTCGVDSDKLSFIGKFNGGGISGYNTGSIKACYVGGITVTNPADENGSILGGITGKNEGSVQDCTAGTQGHLINLKANGSNVTMGGLVGLNEGTIAGGGGTYCTAWANLSFIQKNQAYYGNLGGIAGRNTGGIQFCEFNGLVEGTGNNPQLSPEYNPNTDFETNGSEIYGYGGIVGVNGDSGASSSGEIKHCIVNTARITGLGDANNIANIGGVAGVNGVGASISYVSFGTGSDYKVVFSSNIQQVKNARASVYVGTDGSTTAYAHAGGVAGLNSGTIENIGFNEGKNTYDSEYDKTGVIVEDYRGHAGGIAGYNRRTGVTQKVVTGSRWLVFAPKNAQDNGCGGIIGYQAFNNTMSYCINRATVIKKDNDSNGVGGIVGRMETATGASFTISNCTNYGTVMGVQRVGGIIGVWKYYGGTISDCVNYGNISSSGDGAGGIVGQFYSMSTTAANIVRCENHGYISGSNSGGIAGYGKDSCYVVIQKCVNTGLIDAKDSNGGILGALSSIVSGSAITSCNNYGYGNNSNNLNGIVSQKAAAIKVSNCFGIAATDYPIVNSSGNANVTDSYYLQSTGSTAGNKGKAAAVKPFSGGGYQLVISGTGDTLGLPGFPIDPLSVFDDHAQKDTALTAMGAEQNNIRFEVFEKNNKYFDANIKGNLVKLEAPEKVDFKDNNSASYTATWSKVDNASYYKYSATFYDVSNNPLRTIDSAVVYDNSVVLSVEDINGKHVDHIAFKVSGGAMAMNEDGTSYEVPADEKEADTFYVPRVLPTPKYHLELVTTNNGMGYRAFLDSDSKNEYIKFLMEVKNIDSEDEAAKLLSSIKINIFIGSSRNNNLSMDVAAGKSAGTYEGSDGNIMISAYASMEDYTSSAKPMRESQAFKGETFSSGAGLATVSLKPDLNNGIGFMGITANTLSYQLKIKGAANKILYMRSELVGINDLGVPVVVSSSQLRTSDTTQDAVATALGSLPADLLDSNKYKQLMVRSYPALMSNNVVYTGHTVPVSGVKDFAEHIGLTEDELLNLYVTDDNGVTKEKTSKKLITENDGERSLEAGFVLELAADGTYTLYYNTLLAVTGSKYTDASGMINQVFYCKLDTQRTTVPQPVIHVNDIDRNGNDGDPNTDTLEITWDLPEYKNDKNESNYTVGAVYDYIITGTTLRGNQSVQIKSGVFTTKKGEENVLALNTNTWNYKKVVISINRRGTANDKGMTTVFPSGATKECALKVRFSQITRPEIALHKDKDGVVQKNSLIYDVTWLNVPESERLPENDVSKTELAAYEVTIESQSQGTKVWNFPADAQMLTEDKITVTVDLNAYSRGETIAVSVRALAKSGEDITYRDGSRGVVRELTLPSRLDVPTTGNLTLEPKFDSASSMTLEEFNTTGIKLHMHENSNIQQGKYELAIAVYDKPDSNLEDASKVTNSGDGDETEPGYWNTGAIKTIAGKEKSQRMNGDLKDSEYGFKLDDAYAGKWLKIALRSTSESNVSSEWSDEDAAEDGTINYCWLRIPRIQAETPELKQDQIRVYYDNQGTPAFSGPDSDIRVDQTTLAFSTVNNADQYQIQMIRTAKPDAIDDPDRQYTVSYVDWIYLEKSGEGYNVFYMTTDPGISLSRERTQPVSQMNKDAYFIGLLSEGTMVRLPYTGTIHDEPYDKDYQTASFLQLAANSSGKVQITVILPDAQEIVSNTAVKTVLFTSQVSVQAKISDSLYEYYADSMVNNWYRTATGGTEIVTLEDYASPTNITIQNLNASDREDTAYELSASARNWLVYKVDILDDTGNVMATRFVSAYGYGTSQIDTLALFSDKDFAEYKGRAVNIYAAEIIKGQRNSSGSAGGLSRWTDAIAMTLPELKLNKPEVVVTDGTGTAKVISPDITETNAVVDTHTYIWTGDKKAGSYDIVINGQSFNTKDVTSNKVMTLVASVNVVREMYKRTEPPENELPQSPSETQTAEFRETQQTAEPQNVQQGETQPVAGDSQQHLESPIQESEISEAVYQLTADVTLDVQTVDGRIIYKLTVPDASQEIELPDLTKAVFSFARTDGTYVEIRPVALNDNYDSEPYTIPE